jgi:hypothetical protein
MGWKEVALFKAQTGQINCPFPETTATLAAVASAGVVCPAGVWPNAAGAKSPAITNAAITVVLSLSKTTS